MEPWYKVTQPRPEILEGRSFNPDEFAIALEQVIAATAPQDYRDPKQFFDRTSFTRALKEHMTLVLRRLNGETQNAPPVLSMITQFGGGKTHTLAALYHLVKHPKESAANPDVHALLRAAGSSEVPKARVAVFVGNAWDPSSGKETPWIDIAWQLAGSAGVEALGAKAVSTPPGTEALSHVFQAAGGRVLVLMDEVLNFFNRHRDLADQFYAFFDNLNRAMTGTTGGAIVVSLPRSQVEMTGFDQEWLDRINKVVHRVAKDLIANDESEISEVVRRRLFEDAGKESVRRAVAKAYADWCFERNAQLPPEWTAVDTATTEAKARDYLRSRFEAAYPFHPATISVFQRKWQGLASYQRTRGTLGMFAQWISWAARDAFKKARREPLITLGSAPLDVPDFQATILGQLGEQRLLPAIEVDVAGGNSHAKALDADTKGSLRDIHRRVGSTILFESAGVASDKAAHLPEIRFALGEPDLDLTSIDTAAANLEKRAYFIRKVGTDGYRIGYKPTLKKVVGDRRAALDDHDVVKAIRAAVKDETNRAKVLSVHYFPSEGAEVPDTPKLVAVVLDPDIEWNGDIRTKLVEWTRNRGTAGRFYPAALVWLVRKPGRTLRERAEMLLAWKRVADDLSSGTLGTEFDESERREVAANVKESDGALRDEVWASYRYAIVADPQGQDGLKEIDLGAGHASAAPSLTSRVVTALKSEGLLSESVGAGYIERNWPTALKDSGAWPLSGLRQSFLNGSLTRLLEPEDVLRRQIAAFVERGDFGLASGLKNGGYKRLWWKQPVPQEEIAFDENTFLLLASAADKLARSPSGTTAAAPVTGEPATQEPLVLSPISPGASTVPVQVVRIRLIGSIPAEQWNKLGTRLIPRLRAGGQDVDLRLDASVTVSAEGFAHLQGELKQAIRDLGLDGLLKLERL